MRTGMEERLFGAIGAALIVLLIGYAMLAGMRVEIDFRKDRPITLLAITLPHDRPLYPARKTVAADRRSPRPAEPPAARAKATDIVVSHPVIPQPMMPLMVAAPTASVGTAASSGAANDVGPGQGAGGAGPGNGSGGPGDGDGGDTPPLRIGGRLKISDLSPELRAAGAAGTVSVRYTVDIGGHAIGCRVTQTSGVAELDRQTCMLIEQRFRFDPSRDDHRRPVLSEIEESHSWIIPPPR